MNRLSGWGIKPESARAIMQDLPVPPSPLPERTPAALADRLIREGATLVRSWREAQRTYMVIEGPRGSCFARFSADPDDIPVLEHEVRTRERVRPCGAFGTPAVIASGPGWMLEELIAAEEPGGPGWVDAAVRAGAAVADAGIEAMAAGTRRAGRRRVRLLLRTARSPLALGDVLSARRLFASSALPRVVGHGDFHAGNILVSDGLAWLIDWELAARQPAGYDLMQLWATLPDSGDRDRVFEGAVAWLGAGHRRQLAELRFVALVRTLTAKLFPQRSFDHDPEGAARLLELLPEARAHAGLSPRL